MENNKKANIMYFTKGKGDRIYSLACRGFLFGEKAENCTQVIPVFADRTVADKIRDGYVMVNGVTKDKGTYAFVTGEMAHITLPSEEKLLSWLEKNGNFYAPITFLRNKFGDEFVGVGILGNSFYWYADYLGIIYGDNIERLSLECESSTFKGCEVIKQYESVGDYFTDCYLGLTQDELLSKFYRVPYEIRGAVEDIKFYCDLMDEVCSGSFIREKKKGNISFFDINPSKEYLSYFAEDYSAEEIEEIVKIVNETNRKAKEELDSAMKKGKLRMRKFAADYVLID